MHLPDLNAIQPTGETFCIAYIINNLVFYRRAVSTGVFFLILKNLKKKPKGFVI